MSLFSRLYRLLLQVLCVPIFLSDFFRKETGWEYGIGFWAKCVLVYRMIRNNNRIVSGSTFIEHLLMASVLFRIPKSVEGVVVECGTYKGVSAANLSLACQLVNRRLEIFDSFEGLPVPSERDKAHVLMDAGEIHTYSKGSWCGTLEEVKGNISRYGDISVCAFHKGYFEETLPKFQKKSVFVWLDVDYRDSLETCLRYLWPLLADGAYLYTHEAGHMEIASLFFSESWWRDQFGLAPPGLVGAGSGLGIKILSGPYFNSSLGYTVKNPKKQAFTPVPQLGGMKLSLASSVKLTKSKQQK